MEPYNLTGDVDLTGDDIAAFCDLLQRVQPEQPFDIGRLRTATRIVRRPSLHETEFRVTLDGQRGVVTVPVRGV